MTSWRLSQVTKGHALDTVILAGFCYPINYIFGLPCILAKDRDQEAWNTFCLFPSGNIILKLCNLCLIVVYFNICTMFNLSSLVITGRVRGSSWFLYFLIYLTGSLVEWRPSSVVFQKLPRWFKCAAWRKAPRTFSSIWIHLGWSQLRGGGRLLLTSSWRGKNATGHLGYRGQSAPTPSKVPSSAMAIVQQLEQSQSEGRGQVGRICRSRGEDWCFTEAQNKSKIQRGVLPVAGAIWTTSWASGPGCRAALRGPTKLPTGHGAPPRLWSLGEIAGWSGRSDRETGLGVDQVST